MTTAVPRRSLPPQPGLVLAPLLAADAPPPASRWPWFLQVLVCPVLLALALFTPMLAALVPGADALNDPSTPMTVVTAVLLLVHGLTLLVAVGGVALLLRLDGGRRLRDVGWRRQRRGPATFALGVLVSVVVVVALGVPLSAGGALRAEDAALGDVPAGAVAVIGLSQAFLLQALPEELIFRGYLLGSLRMRPVPAVLTSGLVFGALHLASSGGQQGWGERVAYLAMPIGFGLAAGALALLTRSLWVAVGVHGGLHVTLLAFVLLERADPSLAMGNGPALWLLAGLGWALVAAGAMLVLGRRGGAPAWPATTPAAHP